MQNIETANLITSTLFPNMDIQTFAEVGTDFPGTKLRASNQPNTAPINPDRGSKQKFEDYDDEPF